MAEEIKVVHSAGPAIVGTGRKRGRPRKDESRGSNSTGKKYQGSHSSDIPIGQAVTGVLDGRFDAGYMLTVQVENTGTVLRGVVFEPGRFHPISPTNDIAPHLTMVPRAEIPIHAGPEMLYQTSAVKIKIGNAATLASPADKAGVPPLTGTGLVPLTLTPTLPVAQAEPLKTEDDLKNLETTAGHRTTPHGSADTAHPLFTSDSRNSLEVQNSDDKKPDLATPESIQEITK